MKTSKSLVFGDLSFKYSYSVSPGLGIILSKKYGNAVCRNLFRRRCRSLFKAIIIDNKIFYSVVVRPTKQYISHSMIDESFASLYNQLLD